MGIYLDLVNCNYYLVRKGDWIHTLEVQSGCDLSEATNIKIGGEDTASILATRSNIILIKGDLVSESDKVWPLKKFNKFFSYCQHLKINAANASITLGKHSRVRKVTLVKGGCKIEKKAHVEQISVYLAGTPQSLEINSKEYKKCQLLDDTLWIHYLKKEGEQHVLLPDISLSV